MQEGDAERARPIDQVREGMTVVDATDEPLGTVAYIERGSGQAKGASPSDRDDHEPEVPEPERTELLRAGFIKVEGSALTETDRYVKSERIAAVSGDTVKLTLIVTSEVTG